MNCAQCKTESKRGYFQVMRVDAEGQPKGQPVHACSLVCLIQWLYRYGVSRGLQGVGVLAGIIEKISSLAADARGTKKKS